MKDKELELSVAELETLCNLYLDCKLSVLEETELYFVLLNTDKESVLINDTRSIMGVERRVAGVQTVSINKTPFYKRFVFYGAAAVLILVFLGIVKLVSVERPINQSSALTNNMETTASPEEIILPESTKEPINVNSNVAQEDPVIVENTKKATKKDSRKKIQGRSKKQKEESYLEEGYTEITDEKEANIILHNVDMKITAIIERGINAQNKMSEIDDKINNLINKI